MDQKHSYQPLKENFDREQEDIYRNQQNFWNQFKALFIKNMVFQKKQIAANIFQFLIPLISIFLIWFVNYELSSLFQDDYKFEGLNGIPFFLNLPFSFFSQSAAYPISVQNCNTWFSIKNNIVLSENQISPEKLFKPLFQEYCSKINDYVPQFKKLEQDPNQYLLDIEKDLQNKTVIFGKEIEDLDLLPDGILQANNFTKNKFDYEVIINNISMIEYHRDNGFTKQSFKLMTPQIKQELMEIFNKETKDINLSQSSVDIARKFFNMTNTTIPTITPTEGVLYIVDLVTKNYLEDDKYPKIVSSISYMETISTKKLLFNTFLVFTIIIIIPLGVAGHFPMFLYAMILEKENNTKQMLFMIGLKLKVYFSVYYVNFVILSFLSSFFYLFCCWIFIDFEIVIKTHKLLLIITFLLWAHSQAAFAFLFQLLPLTKKISSIFGYLFSVFLILIGANLNWVLYIRPISLPWYLHLIPQIPFTRIILIFSQNCFVDNCVSGIDKIEQELLIQFLSLLIIPSIYILFVVFYEYYFLIHKNNKKLNFNNNQKIDEKTKEIFQENKQKEYSLIVDRITKQFKISNQQFKALNNVSFQIKKGQILGLLGQNGAGKSTLINILTGNLENDFGEFYINQYQGSKNMDKIYQIIGVCPQFDCLWEDLTIEDHFLFYIRLRGIKKEFENQEVQFLLNQMLLKENSQKQISQLSGGMKRRVSIGIALAGKTQLIILDEPTTGLDPINRIQIQQILKQIGEKSSILLTTHLMEEADFLCDQIAILDEGNILNVNTPENLKKQYGSGMQLEISFKNNFTQMNELISFVKEYDPIYKIIQQRQKSIKITLLLNDNNKKQFLDNLENKVEEFDIQTFNLGQRNLRANDDNPA